MLQQTQVPRVVSRYEGFLARFPTPAGCAAATTGDVVRAWAGLGYNRRAVNLHRAAGVMVEQHDGHVPDELDALLALPGVGPYTARAVLVFAFERELGLVDTNAGRFVARRGRSPARRPGGAGGGGLARAPRPSLGVGSCGTRTSGVGWATTTARG